jgi:hypothetical protein
MTRRLLLLTLAVAGLAAFAFIVWAIPASTWNGTPPPQAQAQAQPQAWFVVETVSHPNDGDRLNYVRFGPFNSQRACSQRNGAIARTNSVDCWQLPSSTHIGDTIK